MSNTPDNLRYAATHEWARDEGDGTVLVGISDHAQESLGDVVYVELPEIGQTVSAGDEISVVESVKAASDIYAPVSGEIVAVNEQLEDTPDLVNESPYEEGWFFRIQMSDPAELEDLLDAEGYSESASED